MSNLENDRDERDDDGPEDRGISESAPSPSQTHQREALLC